MKIKNILSAALVVGFILTVFAGCAKKEPTFRLSQTELNIDCGEKQTLSVALENTGSDPYGIVWESDNTDVATVKSGIVTGVSAGVAVIKARVTVYSNDKTVSEELTCTVTVAGTPTLSAISFEESEQTVAPGSTILLSPVLTPNGAPSTLVWSSSDETVATVDRYGCVTAIGEGTATVTVVDEATSLSAQCTIRVSENASGPTEPTGTDLTLNRTQISLYPGEAFYLTVEDAPGELTWSSSNTDIAAIRSDGYVKAVSPGTAVITVTDGINRASCTVTVMYYPSAPEGTTEAHQPTTEEPQPPTDTPTVPDIPTSPEPETPTDGEE